VGHVLKDRKLKKKKKKLHRGGREKRKEGDRRCTSRGPTKNNILKSWGIRLSNGGLFKVSRGRKRDSV